MDIFIRGNYEEETSPSGTYKKIRINDNQIERIDIYDLYDFSEKINNSEFEISEIILACFSQEDKLKIIKEIILEEDWELGDFKNKSLMIDILDQVADELEIDISEIKNI